MTNGKMCEIVQNAEDKEYIADIFTNEGYGQTSGGYLLSFENHDLITNKPSEKEHFLNYYGNDKKVNRYPSYQYLRCPQLLLFISEIVGVPNEKINEACEIIKNFENNEGIHSTKKSGNYVWGTQEFRAFKSTLRINMVSKIIHENDSLVDIKENIQRLFIENN